MEQHATTQQHTLGQYRAAMGACAVVFTGKARDYGTSWRVLRPISIIDQIYIKAWRIRQIQETGLQLVADTIESEFIGIVNYAIIALIQQVLPEGHPIELPEAEAKVLYETQAATAEALMLQKNHDYGEAWRHMSQQSCVDLILTKLLRAKQIVANNGKTEFSEGLEANFLDIANYGIFALIQINETKPADVAKL
jgi:hypothetical protein